MNNKNFHTGDWYGHFQYSILFLYTRYRALKNATFFVPKQFLFSEKRVLLTTVWKFKKFIDTNILREINLTSKTCHLTLIGKFQLWKYAIISQNQHWNLPKVSNGRLWKSKIVALISRKIWMAEKCLNFHTVLPCC